MQRSMKKSLILTFTFCNLNKIEFLTLFYIYTFDCLSEESIVLGLGGYSSFPPQSTKTGTTGEDGTKTHHVKKIIDYGNI